MLKLNGTGASGALAAGKVKILHRYEPGVSHTISEDTDAELERFEAAKKKTLLDIDADYKKVLENSDEEIAEIFGMHALMTEDKEFNSHIKDVLYSMKTNAEYAVFITGKKFAERFSSMDDDYMQARAADVQDIVKRLIKNLTGSKNTIQEFSHKAIIAADDLTPSETVALPKDKILAFVTENGSVNSHTAILARSMGIAAVVGVGNKFLENLNDDDIITVDGYSGEVVISPDEEFLKEFNEKQQNEAIQKDLLYDLKGKETITLDGMGIKLFANIGSAEDADEALKNDAEGIGLFRSEFLFLDSNNAPDEQKQFEAYKSVLEKMQGKKVIIRTLDIGADKQPEFIKLTPEENPALGIRGIRASFLHKDIFKIQLRALYRASVFGRLGIMFPMITDETEVTEALDICKEVRQELLQEGISFDENTEHGIMIETPAAAIMSDRLAPLVDFFSVGTNDLLQYTLACDRQNSSISHIYKRNEPVIRLIKTAADNAHKNGKWIGICGELAADTELTKKFLEMGIDELSAAPSYILPLRKKIRNLSL